MIHLYAIAGDSLPRRDGLAGIDGAAVEISSVDDLRVVFSRHERGLHVDENGVVEHARVIDDLTSAGATVLPARLQSDYADEGALATAVRERALSLRNALQRVAGRVELGVRAAERTISERAAGADDPAAYMRARLADAQRLDQVVAAIHEPLAALSDDSVRHVVTIGGFKMSSAYLVNKETLDDFRSVFDTIVSEHPDLALVCTGPWPPYSFVAARGRE